MTLKRRTPLTRGSPLARSGRPIKKVNTMRQAKRSAAYGRKLAAYRRSETYAIVQERADGRCEHWCFVPYCDIVPHRCIGREGLQHHHKTYARFGGAELPEDIAVLCKDHHALEEAKHPTRKRRGAA